MTRNSNKQPRTRKSFLPNDLYFIPIIVMEWTFSAKTTFCPKEKVKQLSASLVECGFVPYSVDFSKRMEPTDSHNWPGMDVAWVHVNSQLVKPESRNLN